MTDDTNRTRKAMAALTVMMAVFLLTGLAVPLLMLRGPTGGAMSFLCFPVVAAAMASVRHVLKTIDMRLTALEEGRSNG